MQIISYAQNFEDVILWRALKHVERGVYIDIGAQDPVIDSVSLAFYEKGWRGVHVEPTKFYANKLRAARPDEKVIEAAISTQRGHIPFWEFPDTGLSTGDPTIAKLHRDKNCTCEKIEVPCMRLSKLLEYYRGEEIHWLKIDVEGMELSVLQSWQPSRARPWILVVESTIPTSPEISFKGFDSIIIELGYEFVYFDGLNRFYVSHEHPELKATFGPGPNIFDQAVLAGLSTGPFCEKIKAESANKLKTLSDESDNKLKSLSDEFDNKLTALSDEFAKAALAWEQTSTALAAELAAKNAEIAAVYGSTSWRVAAPLRFVSRTARWLARGSRTWIMLKPGSRPHRTARRVVLILSKRRGLVVVGKVMLAPFQSFRRRIQTSIRSDRNNGIRSVVNIDADRADTTAGLVAVNIEPEGVQSIYRQLLWARKAI